MDEGVKAMGTLPIAARSAIPAAMIVAAERLLALLAAGDAAGTAALAAPSGAAEVAAVAAASAAVGRFDRYEIIATARINYHYYVKARLYGAEARTFTLQFRMGEEAGEWRVWEAMNLTGKRGAWAR
ncbi:MAG TPA: hypothetical protein VHS07_02305 [Candidatus Binataceae bacterium]|nr:hypothetical protein [Candidatus Binataceae bacterium]